MPEQSGRYTSSVALYLSNLVRITLDFVEQGHVQVPGGNVLTWYLEELLGGDELS